MVVPDQGVETGVLVVVDVNAAARKGYLRALQKGAGLSMSSSL